MRAKLSVQYYRRVTRMLSNCVVNVTAMLPSDLEAVLETAGKYIILKVGGIAW